MLSGPRISQFFSLASNFVILSRPLSFFAHCSLLFAPSACTWSGFETGRNGSGKSALVRAILFCCGGEALGSSGSAQSDRVKLYEFIRQYWTNGPKMAEVKVTFSNFKEALSGDSSEAVRQPPSPVAAMPSAGARTAEGGGQAGENEFRQFVRTKRELIAQVRGGEDVSTPRGLRSACRQPLSLSWSSCRWCFE